MEKQSVFMNVVVRKFAGARRRPIPRPPELPPSLSTRGDAVRALPASRSVDFSPTRGETAEGNRTDVRVPNSSAWLSEHCANEPGVFFPRGEQNALWALGAKVSLIVLLLVISLSSQAPLRERAADVPLLVSFFLQRFAKKFGKPVKKVSESTVQRLASYSWPGNIRELQNVIERGILLSPGDTLMLAPDFGPAPETRGARREEAPSEI